MYFIGIKEGETVRFEQYESYTEAYESYIERFILYGQSDMWMTESVPGTFKGTIHEVD